MRSLLSVAALLLSTLAFADRPISPNPDDYDVPKYERILHEAQGRLQNARNLYQSVDARARQTEARASQERQRLQNLMGQSDQERAKMAQSQQRINQLNGENQQHQAELGRIQNELPTLERALADEQRRRDQLASQIPGAQQNAERLATVAGEKQRNANALRTVADREKQELAGLQGQVGDLQRKQREAEAESGRETERAKSLRSREQGLKNEIQQGRDADARLAQDLQRKQELFTAQDTRAKEAEQKARDAAAAHDPRAPEYARQAQQLRALATRTQGELAQAQRAVEQNRGNIARLEGELARVGTELAAAEAKAAQAERQAAELRNQAAALQSQIAAAQRQFDSANQQALASEAEAGRASNEAAQAKRTFDDLRGQLAQSERRVVELQGRPAQLRQRQGELQRVINANNVEVTREQQELLAAQGRVRELQRAIDNQRGIVDRTDREFAVAARERDEAGRVVTDYERVVAANHARVEQVRQNIQYGIQVATEEGRQDGHADGSAEGARQGAEQGNRDGYDVGSREGRTKGTQDGIARARASGAEQGGSVGAIEGGQAGTVEGERLGRAEGQPKGQADGLAAGYEAGRKEGDSQGFGEGTTAGHAQGGREQGFADGRAIGTERGGREGTAKGQRDGYARGEQEFYDFRLGDVTIPNRELQPDGSGFFAPRRWTTFNLRRQYPHPLLQQAYADSYRAQYQSSAAAAHDVSYRDTYRRAYDQAYATAYQENVSREYPQEFKAAYDAAYRQRYDAAYRSAKDATYREAYKAAYDAAYAEALPVRHEEGQRDGYAQGYERGRSEAFAADYARGKAEGDRAGYAEAYAPAYEKGSADGHGRAVAYFSSNAVLKYDGGLLADGNADGVFAPGEKVTLTLAVKNFGKVTQGRDVEIRFSGATDGLVIERESDVLAKLAGQTRTTVTHIGALKISPTAAIGRALSVRINVLQDGTSLGSTTLSLTPGHPYAVSSIEAPAFVTPGQENRLTVQVRNVSTRASSGDVTVKLVSTDGLSTVTQGTSELGRLDAGATGTGALAFTFPESSSFKDLGFAVEVREGQWLLGRRVLSVSSSKRWTYNPNAAGLVVVASKEDAQRAEVAERVAGLGLDLWDARVEGQLTGEAALKYADKLLVLPNTGAGLDAASARSIGTVLDRGGRVFAVLAGGSANTPVGALVARYAQALPRKDVDGLSVSQSNFFKKDAPKYLLATADLGGNTSGEALAEKIFSAELLGRSIAGKVTGLLASAASADRAKRARAILLRDLVKEMWDDKEVEGSNFKDNKPTLKLTAFVNLAVSQRAVEARKTLLRFYPDLDEAKKDVSAILTSRRKHIGQVLEPLEDAYDKEIKD